MVLLEAGEPRPGPTRNERERAETGAQRPTVIVVLTLDARPRQANPAVLAPLVPLLTHAARSNAPADTLTRDSDRWWDVHPHRQAQGLTPQGLTLEGLSGQLRHRQP